MIIYIALIYQILAVIVLNWLIQKGRLSLKSITLSVLIAFFISALSQIIIYVEQGFLDPFYLIALSVQTAIGAIIGLITVWVKQLLKTESRRT